MRSILTLLALLVLGFTTTACATTRAEPRRVAQAGPPVVIAPFGHERREGRRDRRWDRRENRWDRREDRWDRREDRRDRRDRGPSVIIR